MARLQDFPTVTPTSSDKLLVVQSQSQGLVPYGSKLDSANPTGTGSLSINRASNTTIGSNSVAIGQGCTASNYQSYAEGYQTVSSGYQSHSEGRLTTASGAYSHAEGLSTTASGDNGSHSEGNTTTASGTSSHSEGIGTTANHSSQHVFGQYNVADTSTAAASSRGNYVEIVGNGTNTSNRSNARTLDWSGNEVLAGDLTYKGNQVLSSMLMSYKFTSNSPITLSVNRYTTLLVIGFAQSIGSIGLMVVISGGAISSVINLATATAFSNTHLTFSLSNNVLTIASDNAGESIFTIVRGS